MNDEVEKSSTSSTCLACGQKILTWNSQQWEDIPRNLAALAHFASFVAFLGVVASFASHCTAWNAWVVHSTIYGVYFRVRPYLLLDTKPKHQTTIWLFSLAVRFLTSHMELSQLQNYLLIFELAYQSILDCFQPIIFPQFWISCLFYSCQCYQTSHL